MRLDSIGVFFPVCIFSVAKQNTTSKRVCVHACVRMCECVPVCVRACMRACVSKFYRASLCACVWVVNITLHSCQSQMNSVHEVVLR